MLFFSLFQTVSFPCLDEWPTIFIFLFCQKCILNMPPYLEQCNHVSGLFVNPFFVSPLFHQIHTNKLFLPAPVPFTSQVGLKRGILLFASSAWFQVFQSQLLKHVSFLLLPGAFTSRSLTHCRARIQFNNSYAFTLALRFLNKCSKVKKNIFISCDRLIPAWPILPLEVFSFIH